MLNEFERHRAAWLYYYPEGNGDAKPGFVLHHRDTKMKKNDPIRYAEWRPEDLMMVSRADHPKLHQEELNIWTDTRKKRLSELKKGNTYTLGRHHTNEAKEKINNALIGNKNGIGNKALTGMHHTQQRKDEISNFFTGLVYWNNGMINKRAKECPRRWMGKR